MLKNSFQGGAAVEIFSCQGSSNAGVLDWKLTNKNFIKKLYEKDVKGYCYCCEKIAKLSLPKNEKQSAYLIQPFLVLQIFVAAGQQISVELCITDLNQNKRRFFLTTASKEIKQTALHVAMPLFMIKKGVWLNLCIDMFSMVAECFKGQTFRCLDSISISGTFRLRKVFTMKLQPPDTTEDYELYNESIGDSLGAEAIPKHLQFGPGIDFLTQLVNVSRMRAAERLEHGRQNDAATGHSSPIPHPPLPPIAFGSRLISVPARLPALPNQPNPQEGRKPSARHRKLTQEKNAGRVSVQSTHSNASSQQKPVSNTHEGVHSLETIEEQSAVLPEDEIPVISKPLIPRTPLTLSDVAGSSKVAQLSKSPTLETKKYDPSKYSSQAQIGKGPAKGKEAAKRAQKEQVANNHTRKISESMKDNWETESHVSGDIVIPHLAHSRQLSTQQRISRQSVRSSIGDQKHQLRTREYTKAAMAEFSDHLESEIDKYLQAHPVVDNAGLVEPHSTEITNSHVGAQSNRISRASVHSRHSTTCQPNVKQIISALDKMIEKADNSEFDFENPDRSNSVLSVRWGEQAADVPHISTGFEFGTTRLSNDKVPRPPSSVKPEPMPQQQTSLAERILAKSRIPTRRHTQHPSSKDSSQPNPPHQRPSTAPHSTITSIDNLPTLHSHTSLPDSPNDQPQPPKQDLVSKAQPSQRLQPEVELQSGVKSPGAEPRSKSIQMELANDTAETMRRLAEVAAAAEGDGTTTLDEEFEEDETLDLVFDEAANAYLDPKTGKHYLIENEGEDS